MSRHDQLIHQIATKKSFLCVGLDVDKEKFPIHLKNHSDGLFLFCKSIIDATEPYAVAYKPNMAFFEAYGLEGWKALEKTMNYLQQYYPHIFTIADAKRGDIGNTATRYAKAFFDTYGFDSITVAPYMGKDSVEPFLKFKDKFTILLALTSNVGAADFQMNNKGEESLYKKVIQKSLEWENASQLMYVVGATRPEKLKEIRKLVPNHFLLIPGVGAQGGDLDEVCKYGLNKNKGLLINSSRGIIYASIQKDFVEAAVQKAQALQNQMAKYF